MPEPVVVVQLSDPHIGARWSAVDPLQRFAAAIEAVAVSPLRPDAIIVSGDIAENGADIEYQQARELLAALGVPFYVVPGNHDDRQILRRNFDVPGEAGEPVHYAVELGALRLVLLDTTLPGQDVGCLDREGLEKLDGELAAMSGTPTILAMHHPPLSTGIGWWDDVALPDEYRRALGDVIERHPQVRRLVGGHVHRASAGALVGRSVVTAPSTYLQARLTSLSQEAEFVTDEPPGFLIHTVFGNDVTSLFQTVH